MHCCLCSDQTGPNGTTNFREDALKLVTNAGSVGRSEMAFVITRVFGRASGSIANTYVTLVHPQKTKTESLDAVHFFMQITSGVSIFAYTIVHTGAVVTEKTVTLNGKQR